MTNVMICSKAVFKFRNVLIRQTWRGAHATASGSQMVAPPLVGDRALAVPNVLGLPGSKSRFLSSLKPQEHEILSPFDLVIQDLLNIQEHGKRMLRKYIINDELFNITNYFYTGEGGGLFMWTSAFALITKALNCHTLNDGTLNSRQEKMISLIELSTASALMRDDIGDNAQVRFNLPAANLVWNPYKVMVAANMMHAINVNESMRLGNDIGVSMCLAHERSFQGQCITNMTTVPYNDRLAHCILVCDLKSGSPGYYLYKCAAQASGASDLLAENIAKVGFNIFMSLQIADDIKDLEDDLKEGIPTVSVIYALKEHPVLEEMIMRRFQEDGDVEKAMELVKNSSGKEKAKSLASRFYTQTMAFLHMLVDSPYRDGLETAYRMQFDRKINR